MIDHTRCSSDAHDRAPGTAIREGALVDEHGLMLCRDCQAPLMYCTSINGLAHVDPATAPCYLVAGTALDLVARIQREIAEDVVAGILSSAVSSFSQLHDYVDANTYGGLCDDNAHVLTEIVAVVQAEVDRWLAAQGHLPTFSVRTPDYEITRVNAVSADDARRIAERIPHVLVVVRVRGGSYVVEPTALPGPGMRRARIKNGEKAGHLATFDADRDVEGLTRWIYDGGAYFDYEVDEVCAARKPFATRVDGSPVVCDRAPGHGPTDHEAPGDAAMCRVSWNTDI